jgi:hypothetical protein
MRAFVVVLVAADHQVDLVAVEQRQPLLADTQVGAVGVIGRRNCGLVHADHHPIDLRVRSRISEFCFQPTLLRAA